MSLPVPMRDYPLAGALAIVLFALMLSCAECGAHDIPSDVKIQAFVKRSAGHLQLLVAVPMSAMREVDFPLRRGGYLDLTRVDTALRVAAKLWLADNIEIYENGERLAYPAIVEVRVSLPSDRSFQSYELAMANVHGPRLPAETDLYWNQGRLDVLLDYAVASDTSDLAIRPRLERLGLQVVIGLRYVRPDESVRALELHGDPGMVPLDPRWHEAFFSFVRLGFEHILDGIDHLLFIVCLVLPFRRLRPLVIIITAFTLAHSITLIASALGHAPAALWFAPLIETLIAISIVYMALENIVGPRIQARWLVAFAFGLIHGFGFSFALRETLQFAGSHLVSSLVAFNVGIELGQLAVLLALVPLLNLVFDHVVRERLGVIIVSAFVIHTAWHWTLERAERLRQFPLPVWDSAALASAIRWLILLLIITATIGFLRGPVRHRFEELRRRISASREEQ